MDLQNRLEEEFRESMDSVHKKAEKQSNTAIVGLRRELALKQQELDEHVERLEKTIEAL
jgi:DNA-binding transcriptional regulator YiaG